jgi:hypothetical protein
VVEAAGIRTGLFAAPGGRYLVLMEASAVIVRDLSDGTSRSFPARSYAASADGTTIAFVQHDSGANVLTTLRLTPGAAPVTVLRAARPLDNTALSPDGSRVAWQQMPRENWELFVAAADGSGMRRLTHEVQHDIFPRFLDARRLLGVIGEARHRRSYLYDVETGERTRLFHNNTVRTVSAEYEWAASPDGTTVLIVAERDGNTISPERSVYVTDLSRQVTLAELRARIGADFRIGAEVPAFVGRERHTRGMCQPRHHVRVLVSLLEINAAAVREAPLHAGDQVAAPAFQAAVGALVLERVVEI